MSQQELPEDLKEKKTALFIYTKMNPLNFSWKDLGVEGEDSFVAPLNQNWLEWFKQNQTSFKEVISCFQACEQDFNTWLEGQNLDKLSGVWIKTDLSLRRLENERFEISGGIVFLEIDHRKNLGAKTIEVQKVSFPLVDMKQRNSALASYLFRLTLPFYEGLIDQLTAQQDTRSQKLVIRGFSYLSDLNGLEKLMNEKRPNLNLKTNLISFDRKEAQLDVTFKGEEKLFIDLLSELKELKSSRRFTLVHEYKDNRHVLKMIAQ
jgi:hypothetical protein